MVDFGIDANGNTILTTTNPDNTIFCASHGDQLLATYRVSVKFNTAIQHTASQHNLVRMYHPTIWEIIKTQANAMAPKPPFYKLPAPTAAIPVGTSAAAGAAVYENLNAHKGVAVGDKIRMTNQQKLLNFCVGKEGIVRGIVKDTHVFFAVELLDTDAAFKLLLENANQKMFAYPGQDKSWVQCKISQIMRLPPGDDDNDGTGVVLATAASNGKKRQRKAGSSGSGGAGV
jgi:hypothetical protein